MDDNTGKNSSNNNNKFHQIINARARNSNELSTALRGREWIKVLTILRSDAGKAWASKRTPSWLIPDSESVYPLMEAVYVGTPMHVLMELFAVYPEASKPTYKDGNGDGFIHILISHGYNVDVLLKSVNKKGYMPLHLAISLSKDWAIIALLLERYKAAASSRAENGQLPLHMAIQRGASTRVICALLICFPQGLLIRDYENLDPKNAIGDAELEPLALIALLERSVTYWAHYAHQMSQSNGLQEVVDGAIATLAQSEANNPKFVMEQASQRLDELASLMNTVGDDVTNNDNVDVDAHGAMLEDLFHLMGSIQKDLGAAKEKDSVERTNKGLDEIAAILNSLEQHHLAQLGVLGRSNVDCRKMVVNVGQDDVSKLPDSPVMSGEDMPTGLRLKLAPSDECTNNRASPSKESVGGDESRMDVVKEDEVKSDGSNRQVELVEGVNDSRQDVSVVNICDSKAPASPDITEKKEGLDDAKGAATKVAEGETDSKPSSSPEELPAASGAYEYEQPDSRTLTEEHNVSYEKPVTISNVDSHSGVELNNSSLLIVSNESNVDGETNIATNLKDEEGEEAGVEVRATGSPVEKTMRSPEDVHVSFVVVNENKSEGEAHLAKKSTSDTDEVLSLKSSNSVPIVTSSEEQDGIKSTKQNMYDTEIPSISNEPDIEPKPSDATPDVYLKDCFAEIDLTGPVNDLRECDTDHLDFSLVGPTQEELEELYRSKVQIETQTINFVKNIASAVNMCKTDVTLATNVSSTESGETLESEQEEEVYQPVDIAVQ
eukprot:CAMPEP_0116011540 /NCGR_PEP_ID=MMETSP0321-20121206/4622_1 /TAXON_ID=163516 /ORGANISM="Leptocylindrus danicus var. danicus, Strain B650" /LENGTH=776 /DNA_ID=CAMNT_0003480779 /DNA_START=20 /DNA_END=2350 /DNA_ORIENTATION=+